MRRKWIFRPLKFAIFVILGLAVFGFVVMHLWNYLLPALFGFRMITFWQSVGLIVLARLLFGGFRPRSGGGPWRRHMMMRWEQMTPEEREKFREGLRSRCGHRSAPAPEPTP